MSTKRKALLCGGLMIPILLVLCGCGIEGMPIPPERVPPETVPEQPAAESQKGNAGKSPGTELQDQSQKSGKNKEAPPAPEGSEEEPEGGFPDDGIGP